MQNEHVKLLDNLSSYINNLISRNDYLQEQLNNFRKEDEIQKLEQENTRIRTHSISIMSEQEKADAKAFSSEHYAKCKGNTRYIVEGTGIGDVIKVQCTRCNEIKDITDSSNW
jgi:hypothetical protein